MEPILVVLIFSTLAAFTAPLGVIPLRDRTAVPVAWIGWANALAAGFMLGAAYVIAETSLHAYPARLAAGALLGIAYIHLSHRLSGSEELDLDRLDDVDPLYGYRVLFVSGLHGATEGVAIGVAMLESLPFGIMVALAMAVHNVPEAAVLGSVLRSAGLGPGRTAGLAVAANVGQVLLAILAFSVVPAVTGLLPWAIGFAVGGLTYLAMSELLPEAYERAGKTSIALMTLVAIGFVVLLGGMLG
ncbi:MAG: ZIP family metal transporter [Gemmatimonadota bacterium]|jgi:zinc transporter, ZIP family